MPKKSDLSEAFAAAIGATHRARIHGLRSVHGGSATANLDELERELIAERDRALQRGYVDQGWLKTTVRAVVEWLPEQEVSLIAALGQIAKNAGKP